MKKDKDKCKKGKESTIGKIIYGFLLFLPLMAIGVTCGYAIFNKNAYQSYKQIKETSIANITSYNQLTPGSTYTIHVGKDYTETNISGIYKFNNIESSINLPTTYEYNQFRIYGGNTQIQLIFLLNGTQVGATNWIRNQNDYITFTLENFEPYQLNNNNYYNLGGKTQTYYTTYETIDNVFYYSIDKVENSNLFNWAENSIIYNGMNEFTTSLSITNTFIPLLLTYWLIISLVYFIYDIVLIIFNVLHRKIHELQDSI